MLIESKHNPKKWICNEAVKLSNGKGKYSYIYQSLHDNNVFFICRTSSFICIKVVLFEKSLSSNFPLTANEEKYLMIIIKSKRKNAIR